MQSQGRFWQLVDRFDRLIKLALGIAALAVIVWPMVKSGLAAVTPAWYLLVVALFAGSLGYLLGRGRRVESPSQSVVRQGEFYQAIWEFDGTTDNVVGPFCKTCDVKMIPKVGQEHNQGRGAVYLIYSCMNPQCPDKGIKSETIRSLKNEDDVLERVREQFRAQSRKQAKS